MFNLISDDTRAGFIFYTPQFDDNQMSENDIGDIAPESSTFVVFSPW